MFFSICQEPPLNFFKFPEKAGDITKLLCYTVNDSSFFNSKGDVSMRRWFPLFLFLLAWLHTGCTADSADPIAGAYSPADGTAGVYLFLADGTGARTEHPVPGSDETKQHPFTYSAASGVLTLRFPDGSSTAYRYTLSDNHLYLTSDTESLLLDRLGENRTASASEIWKGYWPLFGMTAVALFFIHLTMPYTHKFHPPLDDMPELCFPTFSKGQLIQYLIQVPTFPAILLGGVWLGACTGVPKEFAIAFACVLMGLWGLLPPELARRIDGW